MAIRRKGWVLPGRSQSISWGGPHRRHRVGCDCIRWPRLGCPARMDGRWLSLSWTSWRISSTHLIGGCPIPKEWMILRLSLSVRRRHSWGRFGSRRRIGLPRSEISRCRYISVSLRLPARRRGCGLWKWYTVFLDVGRWSKPPCNACYRSTPHIPSLLLPARSRAWCWGLIRVWLNGCEGLRFHPVCQLLWVCPLKGVWWLVRLFGSVSLSTWISWDSRSLHRILWCYHLSLRSSSCSIVGTPTWNWTRSWSQYVNPYFL